MEYLTTVFYVLILFPLQGYWSFLTDGKYKILQGGGAFAEGFVFFWLAIAFFSLVALAISLCLSLVFHGYFWIGVAASLFYSLGYCLPIVRAFTKKAIRK